MDRRRFLAATAAGSVALGAGCLEDGSGDGGGGRGSGTGAALADHPAGAALASQPRRGPEDAPATVVAFEDPSCPACRRFEQQTYPDLADDAEAGALAFYYRGIPIISPWGRPASAALETAYAADEEAFWQLKAHYYDEQSSYPGGTERPLPEDARADVYDRTRTFLASETDVDADAVVEAARSGDGDAAIQTDMDARRRLGVRGTPTFYLFAEGELVTDVSGPQGYGVFANALGL